MTKPPSTRDLAKVAESLHRTLEARAKKEAATPELRKSRPLIPIDFSLPFSRDIQQYPIYKCEARNQPAESLTKKSQGAQAKGQFGTRPG